MNNDYNPNVMPTFFYAIILTFIVNLGADIKNKSQPIGRDLFLKP
jgi:hypothetical protein